MKNILSIILLFLSTSILTANERDAQLDKLFNELKPYGILEFVRSGRVAITKPMRTLSSIISELEKKLPLGRIGKPKEIGDFVKSIVENDIKYLSGAVIDFDGANSNFIY